jgi:hypothetical protein
VKNIPEPIELENKDTSERTKHLEDLWFKNPEETKNVEP